MNVEVKGTIQRIDLGPGTWALVTEAGEQYELHQPAPPKILQDGLKVSVTGIIRDDVMTFAAIGPVLEVEKFAARE